MRRKLRVLALTVGVVGVFAAIAASSAMAEKVPAKFNSTTMALSGTNVTVKKNGGDAKTCELGTASGPIYSNYLASVSNSAEGLTGFFCTGGTKFSMDLQAMVAYYDTVTGAYTIKVEPTHNWAWSPWGEYVPGYPAYELIGAWTNGSGATPSTFKFTEGIVGQLKNGGEKITVSGTLTAKGSAGALLTLSH